MVGRIGKIRAVQTDLLHELGRPPTVEETAKAAGTSAAEVRDALKAIQPPKSLSGSVGRDEETELVELVAGREERSAHDRTGDAMLRSRLRDILQQQLNWREREIINLRFGLGDGYNYNLAEIGHVFKISRERVRQLEKRALAKLQLPDSTEALAGFLNA